MGCRSQSRTFQGPDGLEYKWKVIYCGNNPAYPDSWYLELHTKDSNAPIASSERLSRRDGYAHVRLPSSLCPRSSLNILPPFLTSGGVSSYLHRRAWSSNDSMDYQHVFFGPEAHCRCIIAFQAKKPIL